MDNKYNVDFTFEILKGCTWNCSGCLVDKQIQNDLDDSNLDAIHKFLDDLESQGFKLLNFNLGPTDLFEAANRPAALEATRKLVRRFKAATINTTFLGKHDYAHMAELVDIAFDGMPLKITVPIEPDHIIKAKYRTVIFENRDTFVANLKKAQYKKTYLVCNLYQYKDIERNFKKYSEQFEVLTDNHLNIFVTEGRLNLETDFNRETLELALDYYNNLFDNHIKCTDDIDIIDFTYANEHEGLDWDLFYRNGQIYFPPFIGEPLATFHNYFNLGTKDNWSAGNLLELRQKMVIDGLAFVDDKECSDCQFLHKCLARRLPNLMMLLNRDTCLAPKRAYVIHAQQLKHNANS